VKDTGVVPLLIVNVFSSGEVPPAAAENSTEAALA
jgi:hypothetical protein